MEKDEKQPYKQERRGKEQKKSQSYVWDSILVNIVIVRRCCRGEDKQGEQTHDKTLLC
jgi:hypothetical protein